MLQQDRFSTPLQTDVLYDPSALVGFFIWEDLRIWIKIATTMKHLILSAQPANSLAAVF